MAQASGRDGAAEAKFRKAGFARKVPMSRPARLMPLPAARFVSLSFCAACAFAYLGPAPASAQAGPSLAGKNVQMLIGFGPGGGYDLWGRVVARHIGKHLPGNPAVVPQNMPGAGSFVAANNIYNLAPKDGSVMGIIARDAALGPITGATGARFDPTRITWLGTPTTETNVCIASDTAKVKTLKDLYSEQLIVGDTGVGTGTHSYPKALNALLGMKFKIIAGFPSSSDVFLAMERGEVDGICESLDSVSGKRPDWIPSKKVTILFQGGAVPNPQLKDVPFVPDLARSQDDRLAIEFLYAGQGIGRPFVAPPDMPADRMKMVRDAFRDTMKDPEFIEDARRNMLDVEPEDGEHLAALIQKIYATPKPIVDKIGELIK
jgi:tripartite-type tricarboxylate transporter receptor subunit TctC